jgi:hypothetical protein
MTGISSRDNEMTLNERLDELAERGDAEITIGPDDGQDLEAFQATVSFLRDYEQQGYLVVVRSHIESTTGQHYVDKVRVRLTPSGIEWRNANRQ